MIIRAGFYSTIILSLFFSTTMTGQLSLKLGAESGLYVTDESILKNNQKVEARIDTKLSYIYNKQASTILADLRIRPEIYGFSDRLSAIKIKSTGSYIKREKDFNWEVKLNSYYYNFTTTGINSDFIMGDISANILVPLGNSYSIFIGTGYSYRRNATTATLDINSVLVSVIIFHNFSNRLNIGAGINIEKFKAAYTAETGSINFINKNNGTRFGPVFSLDHTGLFIIRSSYSFLIHNSDITKPTSFEHTASFVFGKKLNSDLSFMLLADYYKNSFRFINNINSEKHLYFPSNIENQVAAKLGYDVNRNTEVYIKGGYFNMDLLINQQALTGWNLLLGIQTNL